MNQEVINSIATMIPEGNRLNLPTTQITNYPLVKKTLLQAGGKYNKNGFIFNEEASTIQDRLCGGEEINDKKKYQFFQTPINLANRMVQLANLKMEDRILEPSAGHGNITGCVGAPDLTIIELDEEKVKNLTEKFDHDCKIVWKDFLEYRDGEFDKIIMNPPFTRGQDIKHIQHAYSMLADNGILVAICANGPRQQEKLQPLAMIWEELPNDTFKSEGTNVNTTLLVITK